MENVINNKNSSLSSLDTLRSVKSDIKSDESIKSNSKKSDTNKEKPLPGLLFLKQSFRTLSVPKKSTDKG